MIVSPAHLETWLIVALAILGVILRPWKAPEALSACLGAMSLVLFSFISLSEAWVAVQKGTDVYLFLIGMMVLAELGRREGLFDWLAAYAVCRSRGSATKLFVLVYAVGIIVTVFLSNDATAVVLTPAVYAAAKHAKAQPLPYLYVCAFIANAASFVLPISNPANLVVYGAHMPPLRTWLGQFGLASVISILVTYLVLHLTQRSRLAGRIAHGLSPPALALSGRVAAGGIAATAIVLLVASSLGRQLGLPTFLSGIGTAVAAFLLKREAPWPIIKNISWSVLPLVAGLFVLVQGIESTGVLAPLVDALTASAKSAPRETALLGGSAVAVICNIMNNLPLGLLTGAVAGGAQVSPEVTGALLIGVDLGPNLSVTGSLATILWLVALRREGQQISAWRFLALGSLVMPPTLLAALASFIWLAL